MCQKLYNGPISLLLRSMLTTTMMMTCRQKGSLTSTLTEGSMKWNLKTNTSRKICLIPRSRLGFFPCLWKLLELLVILTCTLQNVTQSNLISMAKHNTLLLHIVSVPKAQSDNLSMTVEVLRTDKTGTKTKCVANSLARQKLRTNNWCSNRTMVGDWVVFPCSPVGPSLTLADMADPQPDKLTALTAMWLTAVKATEMKKIRSAFPSMSKATVLSYYGDSTPRLNFQGGKLVDVLQNWNIVHKLNTLIGFSGSGLFQQADDGSWKLVGVHTHAQYENQLGHGIAKK
eukprot:TRINITY_DN67355_c2_g1_i15.p2 TRINITY_DN67355_c2_g1~~TRINITY_DN67355_c2_g1_i15.p2  ORF type:complete len:286 (+),score=30.22 TRINITY_DN67355_c2_g1_i15:155-1012(+)